ncbi:MAG: ferritin [Thermoguttaceae bacterium]|nr:ferritin [Thermoguttaceae bacterium]
MAISTKVEAAINAQIVLEHYSSYLYLAMSAWADSQSLKGFANWYRVQSREELNHAWILYQYLLERRGTVRLGTIPAPEVTWKTVEDLAIGTIAAEEEVTSKINALATLAMQENDYATCQMLQWFIAEQVEEENNAHEQLDQIRLSQNTPAGLLFLDKELMARTYIAPTGTPVTLPF